MAMSSPAVGTYGVNFHPTDEEIIKHYLLPRIRGEPQLFPGLIIEDNAAPITKPWDLFRSHGVSLEGKAPVAFFYAYKKGKARKCLGAGAGTWKSQRNPSHVLVVDGENVKWNRHMFNYDEGKGSLGWVMHEYSIASSPEHKILRISFTGHGKMRTRDPDADGGIEPATKRPRHLDPAAAEESAGSGSGCNTTTAATQASADDDLDPSLLNISDEVMALAMDLLHSLPDLGSEEEAPLFTVPTDGARTTTQQQTTVDQDLVVPHDVDYDHFHADGGEFATTSLIITPAAAESAASSGCTTAAAHYFTDPSFFWDDTTEVTGQTIDGASTTTTTEQQRVVSQDVAPPHVESSSAATTGPQNFLTWEGFDYVLTV